MKIKASCVSLIGYFKKKIKKPYLDEDDLCKPIKYPYLIQIYSHKRFKNPADYRIVKRIENVPLISFRQMRHRNKFIQGPSPRIMVVALEQSLGCE